MRSLAALLLVPLAACASVSSSSLFGGADPLPSWNEGDLKSAIIDFVDGATDPKSVHFVPAEERIAVFDNDGTLICEKPLYSQLAFMIDRAREYVADDPSLREQEPYRSLVDGSLGKAKDLEPFIKLAMETHTGMLDEEFVAIAEQWLATARHPQFERPYTELVFAPMVELVAYLQASDFQAWICTGGGLDFVRCYAKEVYGIAPENVIGTAGQKAYREIDGRGEFIRLRELVQPINDGPAKPVLINRYIGRTPILAVGNSDGDLQMLEYVAQRHAATLTLLLHHDDEEREFAYDTGTERALSAAADGEIEVISISRDFATVFAPAR
jgi:phosphoserine phosphatase